MLSSIRKSDHQKVIGDSISKDNTAIYLCEYCDNEVIHHKSESKLKIGHFKHKSSESFCLNSNESIEHISIKLGIFNYIEKNWSSQLHLIEVEKWICEKSMRPDIYIETKKKTKIAIEVQATVLTVDEILRRTENYFKENIYVLWVLQYDYNRFFEYRTELYKDDEEKVLVIPDFYKRKVVRLKEFENFMYWCYYKKLFFWDLSGKHSDGFIVAHLDEHRGEDSEFRKGGESHNYDGRLSKVIKGLISIRPNIKFDQFRPRFAKEFKHPLKNYNIPQRLIFTFDHRTHTKGK